MNMALKFLMFSIKLITPTRNKALLNGSRLAKFTQPFFNVGFYFVKTTQ